MGEKESAARMSDAPRYQIRTVADFMTVPADKLGACLQDFAVWTALHRDMREMFGDLIRHQTDTFVWIDDGRRDAHVNMVVRRNEEPRA